MNKYREILRLYNQGIAQRDIAAACHCSRTTVSHVISRAKSLELTWPLSSTISDAELEKLLYPNKKSDTSGRVHPDWENLHKELAKPGVTLKLLWTEYCDQCRSDNLVPLMYSQFCFHYQQYAEKNHATMTLHRKPGEQMEVDWAGRPTETIDRDTGELQKAFLFVATLSYSRYSYVEACASQDMENWISAHVNAFKFFGGVPKMIVIDNLKTGVKKPDWLTPVLTKTYQELAEHYNTAILPARVRKPKDKPNVENTVAHTSTSIIAALRHQKFFSLYELNLAIRKKLQEYNAKEFQKREGSRKSVFDEVEKSYLMPLPTNDYEVASWKTAIVQYNYHIQVEKNFYSVPSEYIKYKVDVRMTKNLLEVYYENNRICSHRRIPAGIGQYSTLEAHMPESHQAYLNWNSDRFLNWARTIGPNTESAVRSILSTFKIEQQGYRSAMALLKLGDKYSISRLEAACAKALTFTPHPSYKNIKAILTTGQDKLPKDTEQKSSVNDYGYVRGPEYYGRK